MNTHFIAALGGRKEGEIMRKCMFLGCGRRTGLLGQSGAMHGWHNHPATLYCWHHYHGFKKFLAQADAKVRSFDSISVHHLAPFVASKEAREVE